MTDKNTGDPITDAMIEAGVKRFHEREPHSLSDAELVREILEAAMQSAQPKRDVAAMRELLAECREYVEGYEPYNERFQAAQMKVLAKIDAMLSPKEPGQS